MGVPNYLVEPYAVLSAPIAFQRFESVARRNLQVTEDGTSLELPQLSQLHFFKGVKRRTRCPNASLAVSRHLKHRIRYSDGKAAL